MCLGGMGIERGISSQPTNGPWALGVWGRAPAENDLVH